MSIFDTLYGFNPNTIPQPNYYVPSNRTTANPPTINPIGAYTDLIAVHGIEGAKQYSMRPNSLHSGSPDFIWRYQNGCKIFQRANS